MDWQLIGPGDVDQVSGISISKKGIVFISTDIGGVYRSDDIGESWMPINNGIKNYDVVTPVIIDPDDEKVLYIGTRGGFFKSMDGGQQWIPKWMGIGNSMPAYSNITACIGSIAFNPENSKIIYMGFGYRPSSEGTTTVRKIKWTGDIYKSIDKGESWRIISSLGDGVMIRHIYMLNENVIYIASNAGLFKSVNAGVAWEKILNIPVNSINTHPENHHIVYLAAGNKGIYKSLNSGKDWLAINNGLSLRYRRQGHADNYAQILIDHKNPDKIYTINSSWGYGGGVYKKTKTSDSWEKITRWEKIIELPLERKVNVEIAWLKSSRRVNAISMDPGNANRIFIGTSRYIYKTEDGGTSWQQLISRKVTNNTWTHRGINLFGHTRVVGIDQTNSNNLYIGTSDHGLVKSKDGGRSWKQSVKGMKYKDNIFDITVDHNNSSIIYVINGKVGFKIAGVAKSYDFGENWIQLNKGLKDSMYYTILLDAKKSDTLYIGGDSGVFKTVNGGENWIPKGLETLSVRKLVFHPLERHTIFAATENGLYKTIDSGNLWSKLHLIDMNLYAVIIDPNKPSTIYVGAIQTLQRKLKGGVFKSVDAGKKWTRVLNVRRIESMTMIPTSPAALFAVSNDHAYHDESSGEGVFRSVDGGISWERFNNGLPVLRGFNINSAIYPPYNLYLSSNGSGAYVVTDPLMEFPLH